MLVVQLILYHFPLFDRKITVYSFSFTYLCDLLLPIHLMYVGRSTYINCFFLVSQLYYVFRLLSKQLLRSTRDKQYQNSNFKLVI